MRVSMLTPLPPAKTGVAHYASMLIPALRKRVDLALNDLSIPDRIYHLGNNPHHEWIYREAMQTPGVIVLHDLVLHHLIVEMTLARGDVDGYVAALRANHGEAGAAWARGRAAGLHSEMGNFLLPASVDVAQRSRAVIVHNHYAADRLRSFGVTTPIHVVAHPFEPHVARPQPAHEERVIGFFGFLTSAKRAEVVLEAFAKARGRRAMRLLVVGEPAPNIDVRAFAAEGVTFTGFVPDEEFATYFDAVDCLVNLRYPSAGETSGTLIRALAAGKPVAVSDYAQFAELPDDCVVKIPFEGEVDALADFFAGELPDMAAAQRRWLDENATVDIAAEGYVRALQDVERVADRRVPPSIPLFPALKASRHGDFVTLRNVGDITLKARVYGQPGYRIIADRWYELPRDLPPGEEVTLAIPRNVRLYHALESIPMLDAEPFDEV
ncbi:MAG TPA: glycosyltransferase family 4 protein [Thermoanaerobaculia bacterium]|nr:glycosyltransferase family 4 protein [Thermoanaerobaculia bacterium]